MSLYHTLRPLLFMLPPERAHRVAIRALQLGLAPRSSFTHPSLAVTVAGLAMRSPVGLAAGFDKNAECVAGCFRAGFGFVEIGTVTPRAQPGNPSPRVFRLVSEQALINRLGFNNAGMDAAAMRLRQKEPPPALTGDLPPQGGGKSARSIIGGNIGKNKDSADAIADYVNAMRTLYPQVDYITANISSPNTPGLRALQAADELRALVKALHATRLELIQTNEQAKPVFVKIAPDNDEAALAAIAEVALAEKLDGLIISNTTLARDEVEKHRHAGEAGGLSGKPLFMRATKTLRRMYQLTEGRVPLIGVGGVSSAEEAYAKILAGASAVQLYTALVYEGFGLVEEINRGLVELLARDGFSSVAEAVGRGVEM